MDSTLTRITALNNTSESVHQPTYTIKLAEHGEILAVHYSPYEWSQEIMLIAFTNKILVTQVDYQVCIYKYI